MNNSSESRFKILLSKINTRIKKGNFVSKKNKKEQTIP